MTINTDLYTYSSLLVTASFNGVSIESPQSGAFITIEQQAESYNFSNSADGAHYRTFNPASLTYIATVTLDAGSRTNRIFQAFHAADINLNITGDFFVKDLNSSEVSFVHAAQAYIKGSPTKTYSVDGTEGRAWKIVLPNPQQIDPDYRNA